MGICSFVKLVEVADVNGILCDKRNFAGGIKQWRVNRPMGNLLINTPDA